LVPLTAGAGLPAPAGTTERVTSWHWQTAAGWCSPYDPAVGVANTALPSTVTHEAVEEGTRYDLHLESLAATPGCPALDVSFVSALAAWPTEYSTTAALGSPCGATGYLSVYAFPEGYHLQVNIDLPAACGAAVTGWVAIGARVHPLHPSTAMVCAPLAVLVTPCAGVGEVEYPEYRCADGRHYASTYAPTVVGIRRHCDYETGKSMVTAGSEMGVVWVEARESSCTVVVHDPFFGLVDERAPCPEEVRAPLYDGDWGHVLP
jgi:hypothetical protein